MVEQGSIVLRSRFQLKMEATNAVDEMEPGFVTGRSLGRPQVFDMERSGG